MKRMMMKEDEDQNRQRNGIGSCRRCVMNSFDHRLEGAAKEEKLIHEIPINCARAMRWVQHNLPASACIIRDD